MKLLVFSDIHGNQYAWRAFSKILDNVVYDKAIFLGDIFGYYYGQEEIVKSLLHMPNLIWLKGNHDHMFEQLVNNGDRAQFLTAHYGNCYVRQKRKGKWMADIFSNLSYSFVLKENARNYLFCHGTPSDPENGRLYPKDIWSPDYCRGYSVVFCGHTHFRMVRGDKDPLWINVGSLGQPRDGNHGGAVLFDTQTFDYTFIDILYDKTALFDEISAIDPHLEKLGEILRRERI